MDYYNQLDKIDEAITKAYILYSQERELLMQKFHDRINEIMTTHRELVDFYLVVENMDKPKEKE